ncbi:hypothetical protein K402DRAFT_90678 [Aulographum hederae CBS 113979]|uniref:Uncharacterized protein n=1 Tax=Aulographum hederae CBS 113979 TaxID=1176131 RepID=A0A6G1GZB6_9PEZI|nr:hypothetical protein K402DRAFT_90678 [Aulographum hederae CBS 113979]
MAMPGLLSVEMPWLHGSSGGCHCHYSFAKISCRHELAGAGEIRIRTRLRSRSPVASRQLQLQLQLQSQSPARLSPSRSPPDGLRHDRLGVASLSLLSLLLGTLPFATWYEGMWARTSRLEVYSRRGHAFALL